MSILKSNSATIVNEPITEKWLKTTCFYDQIIPSSLLKVRTGGYCVLGRGKKYSAFKFSIAAIFAPPTSHWSYKWTGVNGLLAEQEVMIKTKYVWTPEGIPPVESKELKTKGDMMRFIDEVHKVVEMCMINGY